MEPRGTSNTFWHERDKTITRVHIKAENASRKERGLPPLTAEGVAKTFIHFPEPRHVRRAERLVTA